MTVKNNTTRQKLEKVAKRQQHFGIRKLTIGAASVLLGTTLWMGFNANNAEASEADKANNNDNDQTQKAVENPAGDQTSGANAENAKNIVVKPENTKTPSASETKENGSSDVASVTSKEADSSVTGGMTNAKAENKSATHAKSNGDAQNHTVNTEHSANSAATGSNSSENNQGTKVNTNLGADGNTVGAQGKKDNSSINDTLKDLQDLGVKGTIVKNTDGSQNINLNEEETQKFITNLQNYKNTDGKAIDPRIFSFLATKNPNNDGISLLSADQSTDSQSPKIILSDPKDKSFINSAQNYINSKESNQYVFRVFYLVGTSAAQGATENANGATGADLGKRVILSVDRDDPKKVYYTVTDKNYQNLVTDNTELSVNNGLQKLSSTDSIASKYSIRLFQIGK